MSFGPVGPNNPAPLDRELARSQQHEVEEKAARYAALHGDEPPKRRGGRLGRLTERIRSVMHGRR